MMPNDYGMTRVLKVLMMIVIGLVVAAAFGFVTMFLWNYVVPPVFNGPVIGFWHALALVLLSKIFFGFGGASHRRCDCHKRSWKSRYSAMSPEERERFKQLMKEKWCHRDSGAAND